MFISISTLAFVAFVLWAIAESSKKTAKAELARAREAQQHTYETWQLSEAHVRELMAERDELAERARKAENQLSGALHRENNLKSEVAAWEEWKDGIEWSYK